MLHIIMTIVNTTLMFKLILKLAYSYYDNTVQYLQKCLNLLRFNFISTDDNQLPI